MRKAIAAAVMLGSAMIVSPQVMAGGYLGIKSARMDVDRAGVDDPTNVALKLGYQWGVVLGDLGIEAEASRTNDEGRFGTSKVKVDSDGLYLAFRSAGPLYFIARGGVARKKLTVGGQSDSESGSSYGVGLGFSLAVVQFELEYTQLPTKGTDVNVVSLGVQF